MHVRGGERAPLANPDRIGRLGPDRLEMGETRCVLVQREPDSLAAAVIRVCAPESLDHARRLVAAFVEHDNGIRLHSAIGYITPNDFLAGRAEEISAERDRKLEAARAPLPSVVARPDSSRLPEFTHLTYSPKS